MKKSVFAVLILAVLILAFFAVLSSSVNAADGDVCVLDMDCGVGSLCENNICVSVASLTVAPPKEGRLCQSLGWGTTENSISKWFCGRLALWETGVSLNDKGQVDLAATFIKYFMLFLIIVLIYSALAYARFPESGFLRMLIALIVGFLSTFFITNEEIIASMLSYTALGITLIIFFPIMIMGFFTLVVASKGTPIGIFVQKIMWLIYSVYLFFKAGVGLLAKASKEPYINKLFEAIWGPTTIEQMKNVDTSILVILLVVSIAVFIIMVVSNKPVIAWLGHEKRQSEIEAEKGRVERTRAYEESKARMMQKE